MYLQEYHNYLEGSPSLDVYDFIVLRLNSRSVQVFMRYAMPEILLWSILSILTFKFSIPLLFKLYLAWGLVHTFTHVFFSMCEINAEDI